MISARTRLCLIAFSGLSLLHGGCAEELGHDPSHTTRVVGTVRRGNQPAVRGWIEFYPFKGAQGNLRVAPIRSDGSFEATEVAIGMNMITLDHVTFPNRTGRGFKREARSVPAGESTTFNFDFP